MKNSSESTFPSFGSYFNPIVSIPSLNHSYCPHKKVQYFGIRPEDVVNFKGYEQRHNDLKTKRKKHFEKPVFFLLDGVQPSKLTEKPSITRRKIIMLNNQKIPRAISES